MSLHEAKTCLRREGAGPPLILLHGAGGNHRVWQPLVDALPGRRVLAPSLPGRLGVPGPVLSDVPSQAHWVLRWLEQEAVGEPCVFAGWSLGGAIALEIALEHGDQVAGLALLSSGARLRVHPAILELVRRAADRGEPAPMPRIAWHKTTPLERVDALEALHEGVLASVAASDWAAANAFDRLGRVQPIEAPTLVLVGADDQLTPPKYATWLATALDDGEVVVLPEAGHQAVMERPTDVAAALTALLTRASGDRASP